MFAFQAQDPLCPTYVACTYLSVLSVSIKHHRFYVAVGAEHTIYIVNMAVFASACEHLNSGTTSLVVQFFVQLPIM